ncbi:AfsR/SARP family transcriptional regulator [Herbihabitans rhizosphaerae]|uniref:AfsR/SARP family transcriptional regulator n=1 Tax=Herbihabitans rhizosphaerae TaxID=1872711 RepID=UPI00102BC137|nr:tetratricopeptide repeat protein [Herbihabitans rhizosphaerae]
MGLKVRVLGALEVLRSGEPVRVTSPRQRALLVTLAMAPGRSVSVEALAENVWGEDPPNSVRASLHTLVARLRSALGEDSIGTAANGYRLDVHPESVDVARFLRLIEVAERAGDGERDVLADAVALWRGEPVGVDAPGLVERYLLAVQRRADLDLAAGRHDGLAAELADLVARYPLREPLWERLIRALAATGRGAEALAAYAECRERLADELGVEPGEALRLLHAELLAADEPVSVPRRRELPRDIGHFTGRADEVRRLLDAGRAAVGRAVVISAIDGMAGIGKTTLAVRVARQLAPEFPDSQLWIDLYAHTPGQRPLGPNVALDRLLRAVGIPGAQVPEGLDERAALWRTTMAGRRSLIVLDNARDSEQVRPLLPGADGCLVLVTSRRRLVDLEGAHAVSLDVMPSSEALDLFTRVVGDDRPAAEPEASAEVVESCGRLPLAVRIAASRLRHRPQWTVRYFAARLRDEHRRLGELRTEGGDVIGVLEPSYQALDEDLRRQFRLLGLHPGADFDARAAAALADLPVEQAEDRLQRLVDANLLREPMPGRYQLHDLVRAYAIRLASGEPDRDAVLTRLTGYYLHGAGAAMNVAYPAERYRRPVVPRPHGAPPVEPADFGDAIAWLEAERANLLAIATDEQVVLVSRIVWRHLSRTNRLDDAWALYPRALEHARSAGDVSGELQVLISHSELYWLVGRLRESMRHSEQAAAVARATGDRAGEAQALAMLGLVHQQMGDPQSAADLYRQAIALGEDIDGDAGGAHVMGVSWSNLVWANWLLGRQADAYEAGLRGLDLARACGDTHGEATALGNLGYWCVDQGRYDEAIGYLERALEIARALGFRRAEANTLHSLGLACLGKQRYDEAGKHLHRALAIARDIGGREAEREALLGLSALAVKSGRPWLAVDWGQKALEVAYRFDDPSQRAETHHELGDTYESCGDIESAVEHWTAALLLYDEIGSPRAGELRATLERHVIG